MENHGSHDGKEPARAPRRARRAADPEERKADILDASARVIARRGARGLRVEDVAREAGVSPGLLYYYFTDRDTLLMQTLTHVTERAVAYTQPRLPPGASAWDALEAVLMDEFQDAPAVEANSIAWHELAAAAIFEPSLRPVAKAMRERWDGVVADAIRRAQHEGTVPAALDAGTIAQRLTATVEGLSARWLVRGLTTAEARTLIREGLAREIGGVHQHGGKA